MTAALGVLVDDGLANFTTPKVCERAGISPGALFDHFATKSALLAAAAQHLFSLLLKDFESAFDEVPPQHRIEDALELLWREMSDARLAAAYDLYTAARTDPVLRADLEPVVAAHSLRIYEMAGSVFAETGVQNYGSVVSVVILTIQGLLVNQMAHPNAAEVEAVRRTLQQLARAMLADPVAETRSTTGTLLADAQRAMER